MVKNRAFDEIINFIASFPTPNEILAFKPSSFAQQRVEDLVYKKKESSLNELENIELDRFLLLEHMIRMAKKNAKKKLEL